MAQKGLPNSYGLAIQEAENTTYDIPKDLKDEILRQEREARQRQKEIESPVVAPEIPQFNVNGHGGRWDSKIGKTLGFIEQNKNAFAGFSPSQMNWVAAIAAQESAGNPNAVSPVGAQGFMQIMPATGRDPGYGIAPMRDSSVRENVRLGLGKFEAMMKRYNGDVDKALAAYNAGEDNVDKALKRASQYGGNWMNYLPRPAETIPYVRNVKSYYATVTGGQQQNAAQATQQPQRQAQPQRQTTQQNSRYQPITGDALKRLKEAEARGDDEFIPFIGAKPIKIPVTPQKQKEIDNSGILKQFGHALGSGYDNTLRHVGNASWMLTGNDTDTVVDNVYQGYLQNQKAQRNRTSGQKRLDAAIEQVGEGDGFLDTLSKGWSAVKVAVQEPRATLLGAAESTATMIPTFVGGAAGAGTGAGVGAAGGVVTGSAAGGVGALPGAAAGAVGGAILGGRIGMIAGTTATEAGAELEHMIFERLKKQNKPVTKENIKTLLNDPKFRSEAQAQGSAKGLTLAMVDQLTMGLSGRVLSAPAKNAEKKAIKIIIDGTNVDEKAARALLAAPAGRAILAKQSPSTLRKAVAATGAFGIELMGEPAGEAISQAFARGEVDWSDVTGEFIYGAGNAAAGTAVSGTINAGQAVQQRIRNGGLSTQADTTTIAQQEQPQEQPQAAPQARTQSHIPQAPEVDPLTPANTPAQPERKIGAIERAIGSDNLDQAINAEIEAVNAEQWLGEPGQVVTVSPKQDPNSTYTVTIESYENGEVFARDQDNTPIQFGREDIISATPVQQDNQAAAQGNQPDAAVVDGEVATLDDAAPELLDFGYAAREQSAVTQQDANLSDFETATPQAAPKAEPTPKAEIEDSGKTLAKMNEAELRARIKYLADQAKATGGWNKMLMDERRKVESEINKRNKPVIDDKPYFKWEGMSPAERMAMAEKKGIDPATAKDISTKAWGAIDQSITTKLTAKAAPKKAAQAKAPKIEQPKAEQAKQADFADAVPEAPKATAEAAPFRELIIDAHFNNPRAKAQLIADEVKAGRPRHEVLKQVQGIVSEINAGKIAAPTAAATQVTATQAESTVTKTETATPKAQDQNVSKKTDKIDTTEKRVDTNDKKGEKVERVTTPAGREFEVRHKLVDVSDLIVSNTGTGAINPNYPQQLQPRDRTRLASQNQINEIASKLNPRLLGESVNAAEGAPIVSNDNVVESGNGRTLAVRQAYERGLANDYRQWLEDQGYDTEGMAMPMLVRERVTPMTWDERTAYTKEANERTTLELSPAERATMDAQKIGPILYQFKGGEIDTSANRPFVRAFIDEIVSPSDRGGMLEGGGQLSQAGKRRIQAALVAKAYGDETLITDMFESVDSDIKAIGGALMDVSGEWASMRDGVQNGTISGSVDVTPNLMEAVNIIRRARAEGRTVFELVNQDDIFAGETDPVTRGFVSVFYRGENLTRARGRDKVAGALRHYAQQALATQPGENMFGDPEIKGSEILRNTNDRLQNQEADKQQDLLSSTPVNEQNTGMVGERGQRSVIEAPSQVAAEAAEVTPNPADKFKQFNDVAKQYGRTVNENGEIISQKGKPTGVFITEKKGRVRIEQNGKLLFSGANAQSLGKFLEDYWYDTKVKATNKAAPKAETKADPEKTTTLADGKTKHEMTIEGRRKDGGPIMPGHQFVTSSGRLTTPYPKQKSERYASQWLIDNAVDEAKSRGDRFNSTIFASYKPLKDGTLSTADREGMLMYLYGEQPAVVRSIFKDDDGIRYSRTDQTNTPEFKAWFGDSKVVDANGKPLVVYHGTDAEFTEFKASDGGLFGSGIYLTSDVEDASQYGDNNMAVYAKIDNPYKTKADYAVGEEYDLDSPSVPMILDLFGDKSPEIIGRLMNDDATVAAEIKAKLIEKGFDGVEIEWEGSGTQYVALNPNQIKSATDNVGTFDTNNPDIRFSRNSTLEKLRDIYGYRDSHLAPDADGGFNSHQLANVYPDLNSRTFAREYGDGRPYDAKTVKIMREMQKNPEGEITVYRAVPAGIEANTLNYGDWVAITKDYAIEHGNSRFDGKYKIIEQKVKGSDLYTDGNSIDEWGYSPQWHEVEVAKTRLKEQLERLNNTLDQGPYRSRISMADVLQNHNELRYKPSLAKAFLDSIGEKIEPIYEKDSLSNELKALSDQVKASDSKYDLIDNRPELIDQIFDLVEVAKYREQLNSPLSRVRTRAQTMIDAMQNFSAEQKGRIVSSVLDEMRAYDPKNTERKINETATARNAVELAQAKGEQFDQFIDSRLRSMDNDAETILNSRAANVSTAQLSPSMVRGALVKRFGDAAIAKLERDGVLSIVESFDVSGVEGYAVNGKVTLVADALNPQTIIPTFLHELGGHVGFQGVMNPNAYQNLMDQFNKLVKANDPIALEAKRLAEREINPEIQKDEYLPYLITIAASKQQQRPGVKTLINRIVAAVKAWAFDRLGLSINLNANDVLALSERMVDKVAYQQKYAPAEQRYSYAGKKAWYSDLDKLDQARSMKENGISDGVIRNATGWFTGQDGNWRFEIDDSRSQVKNLDRLSKDTYTRLEEIYEHDELFRNYPVLQDYAVRLVDSDNRYDGVLHVNRKTISINERHIDNAKYVREILAHELQHAIQGIEDFAQGGSINEQFAASVKNNLQTLKQTKQWELDDRLSESAWAYSERDRLRKELRDVSLFETVKNLRKYANMDKPSSQLRHVRNNFNIIVHLDHLATMGEIESTQEQRYALRDIQRDWYAVGKRTQKQFNPRLKDISWRAADLIQQFIDPRMYQELNVSEASTKSIKGKLERRINKLYQEIAPTEAVKREVADFGSKVDRLMNASPSTIYMALAGEIESRDVEARIDMTPEERQRTLPYSSQDEYNDRAIVVRDNRLQAMSVKPENVGEYSNLSASDLVQKLQSEHDGLKLSIFGNGQNATLSKIIIPDGSRGAGIGSQVMNKITEWADQNQKTIALTPSADFGGNKKRLGEFYKRFGFVENKGRNKDFEISESMYRNPIEINSSESDVTSNPDIRFSRVDTETTTNADQKPSFYKELKKLPTDALTAFMNNGGLAATPLRPMLTELASDIPSAKTYLRTKEKMDTVRNDWHARTDTVAQNWLKYRIKNREENKALMNIMHDSTLEQVDPSKPFQPLMTPQDNEALNNLDPKHPNYKNLVEKQERDVRRQDAHARLKQEFDALSPKAKEIYASVRDTYTDMADEFDRVLLANMEKAINIRAEQAEMDHARELRRIKDEGLTGDEKTKAIEEADKKLNNAKTKLSWNRKARMTQMRKQFESNRLVGPYFPLARYGDYFVTVRDAESGEVLSFQRFESVRQQRKFAEEMGADKDVKVETGMLSDAAQARKAVDANFVADVEDILADLPNADSVKDQVWQRYLESLPEMSIRKARIHRKNRAGFNTDAVRAFGHHMFHGSHQLARMTYSMDLEQALNRAEVEVRESKDPVRNGAILNEMNKAHQFVMNPTGSSWAQAISSISFVWFLAGSPKAALANLFQTPIMGVGILAAFDGAKLNSVARVSNQLLKAYADFGRGLGDIKQSSKLTADERNAVEQAYEIGIIDKTQGHDLAGVAETGIQYNAAREKAMRVISWGFHHTERLNREVTFLAAYRIARDKGLAHEDAITKAGDLTWDTHFDYSNTSRPRFMRNDFAKALLVFRNYQVNMLFRLFRDTHQAFKADTPQARREAFTRLAGITGMMMLNAGITGTWMYGIAMVMASLFMGDGEDPDEELKKAIVNTLGPELGGMALYGIPGHVTGTSLSASVGMADLWFRSPESDYDKRDAESLMTYYVFQTLGASFSIPLQFAQGIDKIKKGETYRGIENMVPKMIKDPMKAYRYAREDVLNMRGDKVADADFDDVVKQALGFTPARIAEQYNINTKSYNKESLITGRRSELLNDYYKAWRKDDAAAMDVIQEDIVAFNEKYPEKAIMPRNIIQSIKSKEKTAAEAVNGARYDRKLKDRIVEDQAPAIYK